jgi:hypothetical protein
MIGVFRKGAFSFSENGLDIMSVLGKPKARGRHG